jgi:hypothetical protein
MTTQTNNARAEAREIIAAGLKDHRAELAGRLAAGTHAEFVVVTSRVLRVGIKDDSSIGVIRSTSSDNVFTATQATGLAFKIMNGNGDRCEAITFEEFLGRVISNQETILADLEGDAK